jgi:long-chain acyl-CoA synthetase
MAELSTAAAAPRPAPAAPPPHPAAAGAADEDTLVQRLAWRARAHPQAAAFLQKRHGVWREWRWAEVEARMHALAAGLHGAGLAPGEAVGVACGARIEAVLAVYACQHAGLVPVLLNPNLAAGALATLALQAGLVALVAEDQEQVDKFADVQTRLPQVRACWVIDAKGTRGYTHVRVRPFDTLDGTGRAAAAPRAGQAAVGLFSAGVHREPRHVPVSHAELLRLQAAAAPLGLGEGARIASLFGLADPVGHYLALVVPVLAGCVPCFGEARLPALAELRQCAPDWVAMPARLLDQLRRETAARAARTRGLPQRLLQRWIQQGGPQGWLHALVGRPVAAALGLAACRTVATGYERMSPVSARFLARLGIATRGLYGLAEAGGPVAAFAMAEAPALRLFDGYAAQVGGGGRLAVQIGARPVDTGDRVDLAGGALQLLGREAEMLTLADGSRIAPARVEAELQASPYVNQAVAVGGPAGGIAALVELDEVTLRDWARAHGLAFTTLRSFAESSEVARLIDQAVAEANQRLPPALRIGRVLLLPRALDAANGELTPALALRRAIVRNRYAHRLVQGAAS